MLKIFLSSSIQFWQKKQLIFPSENYFHQFHEFCRVYWTRFYFSWSYFDYCTHLTSPQTFKCSCERIYISSVQFRSPRPPRASRICFPVFCKYLIVSTTRSTIQSNVTARFKLSVKRVNGTASWCQQSLDLGKNPSSWALRLSRTR